MHRDYCNGYLIEGLAAGYWTDIPNDRFPPPSALTGKKEPPPGVGVHMCRRRLPRGTLSCGHHCSSLMDGGPCGQATLGFQSSNIPAGLFFQIQAWST